MYQFYHFLEALYKLELCDTPLTNLDYTDLFAVLKKYHYSWKYEA